MHTAEGLEAREPEKYAAAARLFFNFGLPVRSICSMLGISPHTLAVIVEREGKSEVAGRWKEAFGAKLRADLALASAALTDLLVDPKAVKKAGIVGVSQAMDRLTRALQVAEGPAAERPAENLAPNVAIVSIAAAAYAHQMQPPPANGLGEEKNGESVATVLEKDC